MLRDLFQCRCLTTSRHLNEGTNDHLENGQHNEGKAEEYDRVESLEF